MLLIELLLITELIKRASNMDPFTHYLVTKKVFGNRKEIMICGLIADLPFYSTYPIWLISRGELKKSFVKNDWPSAPTWMYQAHYIFHSLPIILILLGFLRIWKGKWSTPLFAWVLHVIIDVPTHSRKNWAPQFLWPISTFTVDGISWPEVLIKLSQNLRQN